MLPPNIIFIPQASQCSHLWGYGALCNSQGFRKGHVCLNHMCRSLNKTSFICMQSLIVPLWTTSSPPTPQKIQMILRKDYFLLYLMSECVVNITIDLNIWNLIQGNKLVICEWLLCSRYSGGRVDTVSGQNINLT